MLLTILIKLTLFTHSTITNWRLFASLHCCSLSYSEGGNCKIKSVNNVRFSIAIGVWFEVQKYWGSYKKKPYTSRDSASCKSKRRSSLRFWMEVNHLMTLENSEIETSHSRNACIIESGLGQKLQWSSVSILIFLRSWESREPRSLIPTNAKSISLQKHLLLRLALYSEQQESKTIAQTTIRLERLLNCLFSAELRLSTVDRLGFVSSGVDNSSFWAVRAIAMKTIKKRFVRKTERFC